MRGRRTKWLEYFVRISSSFVARATSYKVQRSMAKSVALTSSQDNDSRIAANFYAPSMCKALLAESKAKAKSVAGKEESSQERDIWRPERRTCGGLKVRRKRVKVRFAAHLDTIKLGPEKADSSL
ncbi:hypothetical protein AXG93_136s1150 [Marchantia polymorpha subsp. ruderalis]|uniref:Uncharacterized protein n=1 Tax=Marchantia polymorpha subsp. ruderalis TaxID=1480154 RepID=A0A176W4Z7_MARPO|nr:hypothetical protein AXG93_136s1150 [Marchantia polymorpha subsp. ruderalis]